MAVKHKVDIDLTSTYVVTSEDKEAYERHLHGVETIVERSKSLTQLQAIRLQQGLEEAALEEQECEV